MRGAHTRRLRSTATSGPFLYAGGSTVTRYWNGAERVVASVQQRLDWHENLSSSFDEAEANGYLFAAAPSMLTALEKAAAQIAIWRSINGDMVGALAELEDECRAAIAKATTAVEPNSVGTPQGVNQK